MHVDNVNMRLPHRSKQTHRTTHAGLQTSLRRPVSKGARCCPPVDINVKYKSLCASARLTSSPQAWHKGHIRGHMCALFCPLSPQFFSYTVQL